ncbi:hypothetical protein FQN52_009605 [Onygenales sp. PD_12]|nr:hypothetical protein FQN52_009605 [Onygenales sp. PD_12]
MEVPKINGRRGSIGFWGQLAFLDIKRSSRLANWTVQHRSAVESAERSPGSTLGSGDVRLGSWMLDLAQGKPSNFGDFSSNSKSEASQPIYYSICDPVLYGSIDQFQYSGRLPMQFTKLARYEPARNTISKESSPPQRDAVYGPHDRCDGRAS